MTITKFQQKIFKWYRRNRRDLPWRPARQSKYRQSPARRAQDPYKILVSEVMLQQTQIARVIPKYKEFLTVFPTITALSRAQSPKLLKAWQGLGYWKRALYLRETAKKIVKNYRGRFPKGPHELEKLPGIGHYTARAIACFAFQNQEAFLDTNIRRVYLHFFFRKRRKVSDKEILRIAQKAVWRKNPREWHYALMDYGAVALADKKINRKSSHYQRQTPFEGSFRSFRAKTVRFLLASPRHRATEKALIASLQKELKRSRLRWKAKEIIESLQRDNLIRKNRSYYLL